MPLRQSRVVRPIEMMMKQILAIAGAIAFVSAVWFVLDYALVVSPNYPGNCDRSFWWFYLPIPFILLTANLLVTKRITVIGKAIESLIVVGGGWYLLWILMRMAGMMFHYWIGGR